MRRIARRLRFDPVSRPPRSTRGGGAWGFGGAPTRKPSGSGGSPRPPAPSPPPAREPEERGASPRLPRRRARGDNGCGDPAENDELVTGFRAEPPRLQDVAQVVQIRVVDVDELEPVGHAPGLVAVRSMVLAPDHAGGGLQDLPAEQAHPA